MVSINNGANLMHDKYFIVGPLNLNLLAKQAILNAGREIELSEKEFELLLIMAENEGETLEVDLAEAKTLMNKVNEAGDGFIYIECSSSGYTLKTNWGREWQIKTHDDENKKHALSAILTHKTKARKRTLFQGGRLIKDLSIGAVAAAVLILATVLTPNNSEHEYFYIHDGPVPLSSLSPEGDEIEAPTFGDITASLGTGELIITILNSAENNVTFKAEIAVDGETLYESEAIPSGESVEAVIDADGLSSGESKAVLIIRTYK